MRTLLLLVCGSVLAPAQLFTLNKDQMVKFTAKNPYERFEDGRPKVPEALLDKVRGLSAEEVWAVLPGRGFPNQYEGDWHILHPGKKLVGRVVTAQFMPMRSDINDIISAEGKAKGYYGGQNQWVIDQLQPGDVLVVDLYGKIEGGTFVGDNLFYYVMTKTKNGGLIVDGAIRDLEGIAPMDMPAYFRGVHPTPIQNVMLTGFNVPIRVGRATVLPGDVAFGDREGLYFIPPHMVQEVVDRADVTHVHDDWTKQKFDTGKYKSADIYGSPRDPALKKEYDEYLNQKLPNRKRGTER
jgi:4-hydroxy-4-methyl-2-oxoglutarate aldolase